MHKTVIWISSMFLLLPEYKTGNTK